MAAALSEHSVSTHWALISISCPPLPPLHPTSPLPPQPTAAAPSPPAYLVIASVDSGVALPSAFLDKVEAEFRAKYGAGLQLGAAAGSLNATFGKQLKQLTENATQHPEEFSKVAAVQKKVRGELQSADWCKPRAVTPAPATACGPMPYHHMHNDPQRPSLYT